MKNIKILCLLLVIACMLYGCNNNLEPVVVLEVELLYAGCFTGMYMYVLQVTDDNYLSVSNIFADESGKTELPDETMKKIYKLAAKAIIFEDDYDLYPGGTLCKEASVNYGGEKNTYRLYDRNIYGENSAPYDLVKLLESLSPIEIVEELYLE
jgi:hypothetical protein